ncbi:MAG: diaminopimelate epimerase [Bacteroidota bacterium]|nr:diaminopimelate epimerase [Bacteroidota bacterium]MEC8032707.1 diaminopimelate epimerase [Bacteroidota bacterium]
MAFSFVKYHGAGNDFIMVNGFDSPGLNWSPAQRAALCRRHYGIGADGIIIIRPSDNVAFEMVYYNADGRLGSLCGNGSRCALAFACALGIIKAGEWVFYTAFGGEYSGKVDGKDQVSIELPIGHSMVKSVGENQFFVDTGSPHLVILKKPEENWVFEASKYRWDRRFQPEGCNVNYVWQETSSEQRINWHIRTYERGVEAPTEACGTGNVAALLVLVENKFMKAEEVLSMKNPGGILSTFFKQKRSVRKDARVILSGPAKKSFTGTLIFD